MWIVRDKNGNIKLFNVKPIRDEIVWKEDGYFQHFIYIDNSLFPELKWEDEPLEVKLVLKKSLNFRLSEETKKIIESDTNKTIDEIIRTPLKEMVNI